MGSGSIFSPIRTETESDGFGGGPGGYLQRGRALASLARSRSEQDYFRRDFDRSRRSQTSTTQMFKTLKAADPTLSRFGNTGSLDTTHRLGLATDDLSRTGMYMNPRQTFLSTTRQHFSLSPVPQRLGSDSDKLSPQQIAETRKLRLRHHHSRIDRKVQEAQAKAEAADLGRLKGKSKQRLTYLNRLYEIESDLEARQGRKRAMVDSPMAKKIRAHHPF